MLRLCSLSRYYQPASQGNNTSGQITSGEDILIQINIVLNEEIELTGKPPMTAEKAISVFCERPGGTTPAKKYLSPFGNRKTSNFYHACTSFSIKPGRNLRPTIEYL